MQMPPRCFDDADPGCVKLHSLLFVPGDSERKFAKAQSAGADALILDLEDSVAPVKKEEARLIVSQLLNDPAPRPWKFFVRVNALGTGMAFDDLAAVVKPGLDAILIPKAEGASDLAQISDALDRLEAKAGMAQGTVKIAVVATETATAMFNLGSYVPAHPRLVAMTWGAEDLAVVIGSTANKDDDGEWTFPYQVVRTQCLIAAAAAGVQSIDTLYSDYTDLVGLEANCNKARRDGFSGRIAIHPDQVSVINFCFTPSEAELAEARMIADAFAAQPDAGTIGLNGKMYDIPHLNAARKVLAAS